MADRSTSPPFDEFRSHLKRPFTLTLIGWLLILSGLLTPLFLLDPERFPGNSLLPLSRFPVGVHHLLIAAGGSIRVACGVGLLSGYEWSRLLWVFASFAFAGIDAYAFPTTLRVLAPTLLVPLLSVVLLFRPAITDYFVAVSRQNYPDLR